jgi:hypothetical protein
MPMSNVQVGDQILIDAEDAGGDQFFVLVFSPRIGQVTMYGHVVINANKT